MKNKDRLENQEISVTVDSIIFTYKHNDLKVLLVKRDSKTYKNHWALPGGFVKTKESLKKAAKRELKEETGFDSKNLKSLKQLYTFGDPKRDPRGRAITISYLGLADPSKEGLKLKASSDASQAKWVSTKKIDSMSLAFDHKKIIKYALRNLDKYK